MPVYGKLKGTIHHYSVRSLGEQMQKLNAYSDAQADDLDARGETLSVFASSPSFRRTSSRPTSGGVTCCAESTAS
jgi:tetrahydromethanopterin S-methyltransferase subunit B